MKEKKIYILQTSKNEKKKKKMDPLVIFPLASIIIQCSFHNPARNIVRGKRVCIGTIIHVRIRLHVNSLEERD